MINKQNLWFVTLFSLILVLGVYYVTLGDEALEFESIIDDSTAVISITETNALTALKVASDEDILESVAMYEAIILDTTATSDAKSDAYENLQTIQSSIAKTEEIGELILEKFDLEAFIKLEGDQINVTISENEHTNILANSIMVEIQKLYEAQMYITVKFA